MSINNSNWEEAGRAGLVLGCISTAYMLAEWSTTSLFGQSGAFAMIAAGVINIILWAVKFGACLYLMRLFMLRYSAGHPEEGNGEVFRFGARVALLSAIIYSAAYLAYVLFLAPDIFEKTIGMLRDNPMMDAASIGQIEEMLPKMPTMSFFVTFGYCWLFGTVLSAKYSRNIPSSNPFEDNNR